MIIRNDDVAADTTLREIRTFCEICDRYGVGIIHAVTPLGNVRGVRASMGNATIRRVTGTDRFGEGPAAEYLRGRWDEYAVHGLWHTHAPELWEVWVGHTLLRDAGIRATWFVPPFNEGSYSASIDCQCCGEKLELLQRAPRLEEFLEAGDPAAEVVYLHSWRFEYGPFRWGQLERCLERLTAR